MRATASATRAIQLKLDVWVVHPLLYTRLANLLPSWLSWWLYRFCCRAALYEVELDSDS